MIVGSLFFTPDLTNFICHFLLKNSYKPFVLLHNMYYRFDFSNNFFLDFYIGTRYANLI